MMIRMNYLVCKKKHTEIQKIVIKILSISIKGKKFFSSYFLNFPVLLIVYVTLCLRKQGSVAFCEKSCIGTDTSSTPVCVKKRVMYWGQGIQRGG